MKQQPLLSDELTDIQRVSLASLMQHPGYAVLELLHFEAGKRATESVMKLDPEDPDYDRIIKVRQQKARERHEFSALVLGSIEWHVQVVQNRNVEKNEEKPKNPILERNKQ